MILLVSATLLAPLRRRVPLAEGGEGQALVMEAPRTLIDHPPATLPVMIASTHHGRWQVAQVSL